MEMGGLEVNSIDNRIYVTLDTAAYRDKMKQNKERISDSAVDHPNSKSSSDPRNKSAPCMT